MAVSAKAYGSLLGVLFTGAINYASDTIRLRWPAPAPTPDQDTHDYFNDITNG